MSVDLSQIRLIRSCFNTCLLRYNWNIHCQQHSLSLPRDRVPSFRSGGFCTCIGLGLCR